MLSLRETCTRTIIIKDDVTKRSNVCMPPAAAHSLTIDKTTQQPPLPCLPAAAAAHLLTLLYLFILPTGQDRSAFTSKVISSSERK